jgi:DNA (cytosine-5)-methyltransferase 1
MTLNGKHGKRDDGESETFIAAPASVRRLTPTECERLQALPDGWTDLGGTADSKRYAALGDAVTASVGEWIGRRFLQHIQSERAA